MPKNYVNNAEFLKSIIEYKEDCKQAEENGLPKPRIPNYIGECLLQISQRLATKPNFAGYFYKDEMISDGIENAIKAFDNFDPTKSQTPNPFAYFTQIIWYAFIRRIEKEKKQLYVKHKVAENSVLSDSITEKADDDQFDSANLEFSNDYMDGFVKNYEQKISDKRKSQAKSKPLSGLESFFEDGE